MMYCRHCAKELADQAVVCVGCGCMPRTGSRFCWNCGAETSTGTTVCMKCGVDLNAAMLKSRLTAGLLGIFLGGLGIHRFYLGYTGIGVVQIFATFLTCGAASLWGFIEGILILTGSFNRDGMNRPLKD